MIKSTTTLLGFIVSLSIIYYISYWGAFNINIFQYLAAADIVKGVAYPLRFGVLSLVVIVCVFLAIFSIIAYIGLGQNNQISKRAGFRFARFFIIDIIVASIFAIVFYLFFKDSVPAGVVFSLLIMVVVIDVSFYISKKLHKFIFTSEAKDKDIVELFSVLSMRFFELPLIAFFIANALISGQVEANAIKSGKSFDYIVTKDLPSGLLKTNEKYLLLLGSAGDKYFFVDKFSNEHFTVDKAALQVVKTFHFERDSKDAQAVFERNTQ
jgi:hypothetical protein